MHAQLVLLVGVAGDDLRPRLIAAGAGGDPLQREPRAVEQREERPSRRSQLIPKAEGRRPSLAPLPGTSSCSLLMRTLCSMAGVAAADDE